MSCHLPGAFLSYAVFICLDHGCSHQYVDLNGRPAEASCVPHQASLKLRRIREVMHCGRRCAARPWWWLLPLCGADGVYDIFLLLSTFCALLALCRQMRSPCLAGWLASGPAHIIHLSLGCFSHARNYYISCTSARTVTAMSCSGVLH